MLAENLEAVNKQALEISRKQYDINQRDNKEKRSNDISKLWVALRDIESFTLESEVQYNLSNAHGVVSWHSRASLLIENLIQNPILSEDPILLKDWKNEIESLRANRWFFTLMDGFTGDSIKKASNNTDKSISIHDPKSLPTLILRSQQFHAKLLRSIQN